MNELSKLIKELCTDGVEYKIVNEIVDIAKAPCKIANKEYLTTGKYIIIDQG